MNPLIQFEDALIAALNAARRKDDITKKLYTRVDTYGGQNDEVFETMVRFTAPSAWVRRNHAINTPKTNEAHGRFGQRFYASVPEDMQTMTWSVFLCAASLRNPRELTRGAPGVTGMYELLDSTLDYRETRAPGRLRNVKLLPDWDALLYVSDELIAHTQSACAYEVQFKVRRQQINRGTGIVIPALDGGNFSSQPGGASMDGGDFVSQPGGAPVDGGDFVSQPGGAAVDGGVTP